MEKKVQIFLEKHHMIEEGEHIILGVSGGADSVCLLLILKKLQEKMKLSLTAVHVEHGIRGKESLRDADFVKQLCEKQQIAVESYHVDAVKEAKETGQSLEEAARSLRYRCFIETAHRLKAGKIAVAHHGDDCAETMLFHLSRGTSIRGLCGIAPMRTIKMSSFGEMFSEGEVCLIRPLLCVTRPEVEEYLHKCGQEYCTDSTNADTTYARNRIRNNILPEFTALNSQAVQHMVRTAGYLEEICDFLDETAWETGRQGVLCSYEGEQLLQTRIMKEHFETMHPVLQKNLIHRILGMMAGSRKDITGGHINSVEDLFGMQVGKTVSLPYGLVAEKVYDAVVIRSFEEQRESGMEEEIKLLIPGETWLPGGLKICTKVLPFDGNSQKIPQKAYTKWFDYDKMKGDILLRNRKSGDYLQIDGTGGHKKFKDFLIDAKVAREERDRIILFAEDSHVIWALGYRISEAYKVTQTTKRVLEIRVYEGENHEGNHEGNHSCYVD